MLFPLQQVISCWSLKTCVCQLMSGTVSLQGSFCLKGSCSKRETFWRNPLKSVALVIFLTSRTMLKQTCLSVNICTFTIVFWDVGLLCSNTLYVPFGSFLQAWMWILLAHLQADHSTQFSGTTEQEYAFLLLPLRIHYLDPPSLACFGSEVLWWLWSCCIHYSYIFLYHLLWHQLGTANTTNMAPIKKNV